MNRKHLFIFRTSMFLIMFNKHLNFFVNDLGYDQSIKIIYVKWAILRSKYFLSVKIPLIFFYIKTINVYNLSFTSFKISDCSLNTWCLIYCLKI